LCIFLCFAGNNDTHRWHKEEEEEELIQIHLFLSFLYGGACSTHAATIPSLPEFFKIVPEPPTTFSDNVLPLGGPFYNF